MSKYVKQMSRGDKQPMYELYALINHNDDLGGGHYSAYAKVLIFSCRCYINILYLHMFTLL